MIDLAVSLSSYLAVTISMTSYIPKRKNNDIVSLTSSSSRKRRRKKVREQEVAHHDIEHKFGLLYVQYVYTFALHHPKDPLAVVINDLAVNH